MGGVLGSAVATLSVVVVCFCLSVLLAGKLQKHRNHPMIQSVFRVLRPVVVALILSAAVSTGQTVSWDWRALLVGAIALIQLVVFKHKVYTVMIAAGALGAVLYGALGHV
jgi:chromate transporter